MTNENVTSDPSREIRDYKKGKELRNETTESFVVGGPKQTFYQAEQSFDPESDGQPNPPELDDMIIPYFGLDPNTGSALIPRKDNQGYWVVDMPTQDLALQLSSTKYNKAIPSTITINEREMIMAQGSYDSWASYASYYFTDLWDSLNVNTEFKGVFSFFHRRVFRK